MGLELGTKAQLLRQRRWCLNQLRALGPAAAILVTELEGLDASLGDLASAGSKQYSGFKLAIDAIVTALTINDRTMTPDELSEEIIAGGWLSKDDRARFNVKDSIDYHTRRQGSKKKLIRAVNGRVGFYDWPDDKFAIEAKGESKDGII